MSVSRKVEDPFLIARVAEFKTKMASNEWPACSDHGKKVSIHEEGSGASHGTPNFVVVFSGCSENAINGFFQFMDRKLGLTP